MLILDTTTKTITVAMSGAAATTNPDFVTAWSDDTGTSFTEGSSDGVLNGTSQVTLVAAPAVSTRRLIKSIFIQNKDTAAVTLTITLNNASTLRNIVKVTLQVNDTWSTDGTYDANGNLKTVIGTVNVSNATGILPVVNGGTGVSSLGAGVVTALGINVGTAGSVLVNGGALGTPTSGTLTNTTGLPISTGVSGLGTGVATALAANANGTGGVTTVDGSATLTNKTLTNPTVTNYTETLYTANTGTAITVSLSNGTVQQLTLTGNATITMPTAVAGKSFVIMLKQDGTGSRTVTWTTVVWPGGTAPTITSTASKQDIYSFFSDGTNWYGITAGQNY